MKFISLVLKEVFNDMFLSSVVIAAPMFFVCSLVW